MKLTEAEILRGLALAVVVVTGSLYVYDTNKTNTETQIFADKIITLNKIHNQYELSNVTGYANCIKINSESACLKRMESISKHFANEYNSKLLKIVSAEYGIDTIENKASGRLTAIGKIKSTLDFGVLFDYNNSTKDEYSIYFNKFDSRMPTLAEAYGMNEMKKGEDLLLLSSFNKVVNKDIPDIVENKDEVVSIGSKFAELGLKAQNENSKELTDIKRLLDLVVAEEERNVGAGNAAPVGKAPSLMDTLTDSGQRFFENVMFSPYNEAIIKVSGCNGEELKTEFCIKYLENQNIIINQ